MFYVPLKLREWKERVVPKGPSFSRAKTVRFTIDNTEVQLSLPRNRASKVANVIRPKKRYELAWGNMRSLIDGRAGWLSMPVLRSIWDFYGPWFLGRLGEARCHVGVIQNEKDKDLSYFHPRVFENAILELMAFLYDEKDSDKFEDQIYFAPSDWESLDNFELPTVRFTAKANRKLRPDNNDEFYIIFPIHHNYLVKIGFSVYRAWMWLDNDTPVDDLEAWLPIEPMETLVKQIMASLTVKPSEEALRQMKEAQAGLSDASLVKEFPPVNIVEYQRSKNNTQDAE